MTDSDRQHLLSIKRLPCIVCGRLGPSHAHHTDTGMGRKKNHHKAIPLCLHHHQGEQGIHTLGKKRWQMMYGSEAELLAKTMLP